MSDEQIINMISNCAKMEAALGLLRNMAVEDKYLSLSRLNMVLLVAGMEPVIEKDPNAGEQ